MHVSTSAILSYNRNQRPPKSKSIHSATQCFPPSVRFSPRSYSPPQLLTDSRNLAGIFLSPNQKIQEILVYKLALMKERRVLTRAYTPGALGAAQPSPHETVPIRTLEVSTIGPPLSPWQESLPPASKPAQNMVLVTAEVP